MATALIGLGSNLGDRAAALDTAVSLLKAEPQIRVTAVSSYRPSKPAGGPEGQSEFLNAAALLETSLPPEELLATLLRVEGQVGRIRTERWGPRVIDLDLLLYDQLELKTPSLELPHPRMCFRRFVLEPAAEIAAEMLWPVNGWTVERLCANLNSSAKYLAISKSSILSLRETLLKIEAQTHCHVITEEEKEPVRDSYGLRHLADRIAASRWPHDEHWTVSDFWFDREFVRFDWFRDSRPAAADALRHWKAIRHEVMKPRLVIILEDPVHWWSLACASELDSARTEFVFHDHFEYANVHREFHARLRNFCRRQDCPPTLWLSLSDLEAVEQEVLAAMQAME